MTLPVTAALTVGNQAIQLEPQETRIVLRGEIPPALATRFEALGIILPPRGTTKYHLTLAYPDQVLECEAHMRRS